MGNHQPPYTEKDILRHDAAGARRKFLLSAVISELKETSDFIDHYVAVDRKGQRQKPMIWESLEAMVKTFCNLEPAEVQSDDPHNYRADEIENIEFLL